LIRYFVQQFFFQIITGLAIVLFVGVFIFALTTESANPPPKDVKSQFQNSLGKAISTPNKTDLSVQHMSGREIGDKLTNIIAEALSFTPSNYQTNVSAMAKYFTPGAYQQYKDYLDQSQFGQNLSAQGLRSGAFVEQEPLEINAVVQNGVFKWLFDVPVTVSFVPVSTNDYRGSQTTTQNQRFTLQAQFTRVDDPNDPNAVRIEIWKMLPPRS